MSLATIWNYLVTQAFQFKIYVSILSFTLSILLFIHSIGTCRMWRFSIMHSY